MKIRGVRGAITTKENSKKEIFAATRVLMDTIISSNHIDQEDVAAIFFTSTKDLDAAYPAEAVREMGWTIVPLLCYQELAVAGSLKKCIRALILWNTNITSDQIRHIYLEQASQLRPDLA